MICYSCNSQLPDNSNYCPYCGASFYINQPQQNFAYSQPIYNVTPNHPMPTYASASLPPSKKGKSIAMGITIGVLYIALIILVILLICQRNYKDKKEDMSVPLTTFSEKLISCVPNYDGTYVLESVSSFGMTYSTEELAAMTGDSFDMMLIIEGDKCTLDSNSMGYDMATCDITIEGSDVTLIDGDEELMGYYNQQEESITITSSGIDMKFVKQYN